VLDGCWADAAVVAGAHCGSARFGCAPGDVAPADLCRLLVAMHLPPGTRGEVPNRAEGLCKAPAEGEDHLLGSCGKLTQIPRFAGSWRTHRCRPAPRRPPAGCLGFYHFTH
jgi:hypothetical protein